MTAWINTLSNLGGDILIGSVRTMNPWVGLTLFSLAFTLFTLIVVRFTLRRGQIKEKRDIIIARLLECILYQDSLLAPIRSGWRSLSASIKCAALFLAPGIILLIPSLLAILQLAAWYEYRPLRVNEQVLVKVIFEDAESITDESIALSVPDGLTVETAPLRIHATREIAWRVRATAPNYKPLTVSSDKWRVQKEIATSESLNRIGRLKEKTGFLSDLTHPGEAGIDQSSPVTKIHVIYPPRELRMGSYDIHWLLAFSGLTVLFSMVLAKPLGIKI